MSKDKRIKLFLILACLKTYGNNSVFQFLSLFSFNSSKIVSKLGNFLIAEFLNMMSLKNYCELFIEYQ